MPIEDCIVAIGPTGGEPVGVGFLVGDRHILTCAHVLNAAVGAEKYSQDKPSQPVAVAFLANASQGPLAGAVEREEHWRPPVRNGVAVKSDMAILTLAGSPPKEAEKAPMRERYPLTGAPFWATGFPSGWSNGQGQSGSIGQFIFGRYELLEGIDKRPFVRAGFSGSPVRVESSLNKGAVGVVGMVVAARTEEEEKTAYMVPAEALREFVSSLPGVDICNGIIDDFPHIRGVERHFQDTTLKTRTGPAFDLRIVACDSLEAIAQLFRSDPERAYGTKAMTADSLLTGNNARLLLVQSPGGAGKSNFLVAVVKSAISKGMVPFLLDATKGRDADDTTDPSVEKFFESFTVAGGAEEFEAAREKIGKERVVVLLDRLNENPEQASTILKAITRIGESKASGITVIIADRVKDRGEIPSLQRATVLPLPLTEIANHLGHSPVGTNAKLLAMPFFLEMQLRGGDQSAEAAQLIRSEMFKKFFAAHAGVTDSTLSQLAESAFNAYKECRRTVLPATKWIVMMEKAGIPDESRQRILDGTMLQYKVKTTGDVVEFRHQLFHDFLAGTYLANCDESFWRSPNFDAVTLDAQSFDGIEFAAEQLGAKATGFLIQAYDWNWFGVLESVRNLDAGRHGGESHISAEFKDALYFLNAMRLFDVFEDSRRRTRSILADVQTTGGFDIDSVHDIKTLRQTVATSYAPADAYFKDWKELFLRDEPVLVEDLDVLWSDPLMSWTATSVFRKRPLGQDVPEFLRRYYVLVRNTGGDRPEAVGARWRIVHLLGIANEKETSEFLWSVADNLKEHKNVRAGAIRSYIESAALTTSTDVRAEMLARIANWLRTSPNIPGSITRQLRTSARLATDYARDQWDAGYLKILEAGVERAKTSGDIEEQQAWERRRDEISALQVNR
jgi:hypothetical protein